MISLIDLYNNILITGQLINSLFSKQYNMFIIFI